MSMPLEPTWPDIAIRLVLTMLACGAIGLNRGARGHAAGFRTTILVGLAASVAMIQANILLSLDGKTPGSFAVMDLMRLPLGILTGVGFIGGGSILKKGDLVTGVTTAATLWVVTVIGLCLGGGQLILGIAATLLVVFTLWALKWVDIIIPREHRAKLVVTCTAQGNAPENLPTLVKQMKYHAHFQEQQQATESQKIDYTFELSWRRPELADPPLDLLRLVDKSFPIKSFELTTDNGR
jgi:putative Mg2+ transporter-C (MgtC) family protein